MMKRVRCLKFVICAIAASALAGCGSLQMAQFHEPSLNNETVQQAKWGDGLVFAMENVCIGVIEGKSALKYPVAVGPGLPVIPTGLSEKDEYRQNQSLYLELWLIPSEKEFFVDPASFYIRTESGQQYQAELFQKAEFQFYSRSEIGADEVHRDLSRVFHDEPVRFTEDAGRMEITGNYSSHPKYVLVVTKVTFKFHKANANEVVKAFVIDGISRNGVKLPAQTIELNRKAEKRYLVHGMSAGEWVGNGWPQSSCNKIWQR